MIDELPDPKPGEDDVDAMATGPWCECCGSLPGCLCDCDLYDYYRDDPETGPQSGTVCHTHGRCL